MTTLVKAALFANRRQLMLLLAIMLLIGLLLPASVIYWGIVALGVIGWLYVLWKLLQIGILPFMVGLVATIPVGVIGGLFLIGAVPFWVAMLWPSVINIVASLLVVSFLPFSGMQKLFSFVGVSALLGFNFVIPSAVQDVLVSKTGKLQIAKTINLSSDDFLSVESNTQKIIFHNLEKEEILDLGGNEGCMCGYWQVPRVMEEDVERILQEEGLRYRIDRVSSGKNRLVINANDQLGITQLNIALYQGDAKVADYQRRLRKHYPFEPWTANSKSQNSRGLDSLDMRIYFLAQSNFWSLLASMPSRISQQFKYSRDAADEAHFPLSHFLQRAVSKNSRTSFSSDTQSVAFKAEVTSGDTLSDSASANGYAQKIFSECLVRGKEAGVDECVIKPGYSLSVRYRQEMLFEFDHKSLRVAPKWLSVGKVYRSESSYMVVSHPANQNYFFVHEYSIDGNLLVNHLIQLPGNTFRGKWRKINYLSRQEDTYIFYISDMEDQKVLQIYQFIAKKAT